MDYVRHTYKAESALRLHDIYIINGMAANGEKYIAVKYILHVKSQMRSSITILYDIKVRSHR